MVIKAAPAESAVGKLSRRRVFSGVQPTGLLHLGNYLGAIKNWVALQDQHEPIYCVVDLHALTVPREPDEFREQIRDLAIAFLACGIDPKRSAIFIQSHIPEHTGLAWLLTTIARFGELARMTQFKEKGGQQEGVGAGLFVYPALMAADILLYQTDLVPVGEDQRQHLEFTRDLAERFNNRFGPTFKVPEAIIPEEGARVMALDNPTSKMSKSSPTPAGYIALDDPPDLIRRKIMRAVTDTGREIRLAPDKPAISNLLAIYARLADRPIADLEAAYAGKGYGDFKKDLADVVVSVLTPIQQRMAELRAAPDYVDQILAEGADRIRPIAEKTFTEANRRMGIR